MTTKDWTAHVDRVTRWMRDGAPDATKPALMGHAWLAVAEIITGQEFASSVQAMRYLIESARQGLGVEAYLSKASDLGELVTHDPVGWGLEVDDQRDFTGHLVRCYAPPVEGPGGVVLLGVDIDPVPGQVACALVVALAGIAPQWLGPDFVTARKTAALLGRAVQVDHHDPGEAARAHIWLLQRWALTRDLAQLMDERDRYSDFVANAHQRVQDAAEETRDHAEWMLQQATSALIDIEGAITALDSE